LHPLVLRARQARKLLRLIALRNFSNSNLNDKSSYRLLGVKRASVRLQNWNLHLSTHHSAWVSLPRTQDTHSAYRKVRKHSIGKQPPVVA
jgi:hypothetical protein